MCKMTWKLLLVFLLLGSLSVTYAQKKDDKAQIGKIGTKSYSYGEYNNILENYFNFHSARQGGKLSDEDKARLNNQCWEEQIGRYIYDMAIKSRKIKATDAELEREVLRNTPDVIKQIQDLQTNNRFDKAKLEAALKANPEFRRSVLDYVNQTYQYTKLHNVIKSEVKADADSVRRDWIMDNDTADAKIIYFDFAKLTHINASEEEAQEYYQTNLEAYRKENGRTYRYYRFARSVGADDSLATKVLVDSLYQRALAGEDFASLASEYSKDPGSAAKGGDLGFFSRGRMVKPFEDAAFNTPVGEVSLPVQSQFGWHIIKVIDKRVNGGNEEVQASHILIRIEMSEENVKRIKSESQKLYSTAQITGLVPAAALYDYELSVSDPFLEIDRSIPGIGSDPNLISFAFNNPPGTLYSVHTAANGDLYVMEVADSLNIFHTPFEREKTSIMNKLTREKRINHMRDYAVSFALETKPDAYFTKAERDTILVVEVSKLKKGANIPSIGRADVLVDAILGTDAGNYTSLINNENYWYIAYVSERNKPNPKDWDRQKSDLIRAVEDNLQQQHLNVWYNAEKRKLEIEDKRKDFYDLSAVSSGRQIQLSPK